MRMMKNSLFSGFQLRKIFDICSVLKLFARISFGGSGLKQQQGCTEGPSPTLVNTWGYKNGNEGLG